MPLSPIQAQLQQRHNLRFSGEGADTLLFVHGLGCDQAMWRFVAPHFEARARVIRMDLMGFGASLHSDWSEQRYADLDGHARDIAAVAEAFGNGRCIVVGHSVSTMIGLLADAHAPQAIAAHAMVAPSPCYLNDGDYRGGFDRAVLDQTLGLMETDVEAWTQAMMPLLLAPDANDPMAQELTSAFCRARPEALVKLARATFLGDLRGQLPGLAKPVLLLQCDQDMVAPRAVGDFMASALPDCTLAVIRNPGHCPHLTTPQACIDAIGKFLDLLAGREAPGVSRNAPGREAGPPGLLGRLVSSFKSRATQAATGR
ncbi:alpha/beta fold hydrolase [Ramlibacter sp. MAHUQ-53]|uniref:alpha/beta fold hydrolase n=1 Tax=unclassified Ramlibacter TaxID=2617605 RepID=UPI003635769D